MYGITSFLFVLIVMVLLNSNKKFFINSYRIGKSSASL